MNDINTTLNERGKRYGSFVGHSDISQDLKNVMQSLQSWNSLSSDKKEALEMIQHKVARILNGDPEYHDNWHDISGYATLVANTLQGNK